MDSLFFSRMIRGVELPRGLDVEFATTANVVSHGTISSPPHTRCMLRDSIFGRRTRASAATPGSCRHLSLHMVMKKGRPSLHCRFNAVGKDGRPIGKFLVFGQPGQLPNNMIRAGKWTHAMALRNTFIFTRWIHGERSYVWLTATSAPNMVMSGKLRGRLPSGVRGHWRSTHTTKFPGVAIETTGTCTPEMYDSGAFIIPGVKTKESLEHAFEAIRDVCS